MKALQSDRFPPNIRTEAIENLEVLVVEPQPAMLRFMRDILSDLGIQQSAGAARADDALLKLHERRFSLVIADTDLPEIDGIDLVRQIRTGFEDERRCVPILLTMSLATVGRIREARDAGVTDILLKPLSIRGLEAKITRAAFDRRPFIETATYSGPDRRRARKGRYAGPMRRRSDRDALLV